MSKCVLYCGGILTCKDTGEAEYNVLSGINGSSEIVIDNLFYPDGNQANPTDATAFIYVEDDNGSHIDVIHSCCSAKMTCTYTGRNIKLFSEPNDIWREEYVDSDDNLVFSFFAKNNNNGNTELFPIYAPKWFGGNIKTVKYSFKNDNNDGDTDIPSATTVGMFSSCTALTSCDVPCEMRCISNDTFNGCTSLTSYTTNPQFVEHIGERAFQDCTGLTNIEIGKYSNISEWSFGNCSSARTIKFFGVDSNGNGKCNMNEIPSYAFQDCISLSGVTFSEDDNDYNYDFLAIPNSVSVIGEYAFSFCQNLKYIQLGFNCEIDTINGNSIITCGDRGDNSGYVGSGVTSISGGAFYNCTSVTSCTIGSGVTKIENGAFGFNNLESLVYNSAKAFSRDIFYYDSLFTSLTTLKFGDAVTAITAGACSGFTALTTVEIGTGIQNIGANAFENCTNIGSITIYATTPPTLDSTAFYNTNNDFIIYVPSESVNTYKNESGWKDLPNKDNRIQQIEQ